MVGLYSFLIGGAVRVKPNVLEPRHQWGQVREIGEVELVALQIDVAAAHLSTSFNFLTSQAPQPPLFFLFFFIMSFLCQNN